MPEGAYDEYSERGESENRNQELKCELCADRVSDYRYMANCSRMFMHCLANNMLVRMRRRIATPLDEPAVKELAEDAAQGQRISQPAAATGGNGATRAAYLKPTVSAGQR